MHELGITQEIVAIACKHAKDARIVRIVVEIGKLSMVLPDAVEFCYDLCCEGTAAEGSTLEIRATPGRARCRACGNEWAMDQPYGFCECGNCDLEWLRGMELKIHSIELDSTAACGLARGDC